MTGVQTCALPISLLRVHVFARLFAEEVFHGFLHFRHPGLATDEDNVVDVFVMTIGPLTDDEAAVRKAFASLRELWLRARSLSGRELPVLSMGMSGDFEWAVLEGSTMVRIGTAIFGDR